jgi:hypothetical protein
MRNGVLVNTGGRLEVHSSFGAGESPPSGEWWKEAKLEKIGYGRKEPIRGLLPLGLLAVGGPLPILGARLFIVLGTLVVRLELVRLTHVKVAIESAG